jgi:hypothetical protein
MKRIVRLGAAAALFGLLAMQIAAMYVYERDQRVLHALANQIVSPNLPPSEQTKAFVRYFRDKSDRDNHGYLFLPVLGFLRPTPLQIANSGGWCSDRSRLLVVLLELHDIRGEIWALYSPNGIPKHAIVEVSTEHGQMVADPLFGLWFPRPEGGYYGINDLKTQPEILANRLHELIAHRQEPGSDPPAQYPINLYIYAHPRTINWHKNLATLVAYKFLHFLIGARVDRIPRPQWTEQPALMLTFGIVPGQIILLAVFFWARPKTKLVPKADTQDPNPSSSNSSESEHRESQVEEFSRFSA